jgi:hypothetical protein
MSKKKPIRTEADLDAAVDALPIDEVRMIVKQIATQWYVENDGTLNLDKELDSDQLEAVTQALSSRGIYPTNSDGPVEKDPYELGDYGGTDGH